MMTDEDNAVAANSDEESSPARPNKYDMSSSPGVTNFNIDSDYGGSPARSKLPGPKQQANQMLNAVKKSLTSLVNA